MTRYSRYEDAMVRQQDILRWSRSAPGKAYLGSFLSGGDRAAHVALEIALLEGADPVYVSVDACELVRYALDTFRPEAVLPNDAFAPAGFALLAQPLLLPDAPWSEEQPGRSLSGYITVRAIGWMSVHDEDWSTGSFLISYYNDPRDDYEHMSALGMEGHRVDLYRRELDVLLGIGHPYVFLMHRFAWRWGSKMWEDDNVITGMAESSELSVEHAREAAEAQVRLVQCFWRIASQLKPARERAPRGIWRDYTRSVRPAKDVTVIHLRRSREAHDVEPAGRSLSVRFPVRGHWRNQWFRSLGPADDPESHRQVWISPYVKGPEGAPFVAKPRAWEFTS